MALTKRNYVDGETVITAANLNAIQDEIILQGTGKADKNATVSTVTYDSSNHTISKTINGTSSSVVALGSIVDFNVVAVTE